MSIEKALERANVRLVGVSHALGTKITEREYIDPISKEVIALDITMETAPCHLQAEN
jgi:hypothetical protein